LTEPPPGGRSVIVDERIVEITGSRESLHALLEVDGMAPAIHSTRALDGRWTVEAHATGEACRSAEALGCTVRTLMDERALAAHRAHVFGQVEREPATDPSAG
jgi:hypothetical protein